MIIQPSPIWNTSRSLNYISLFWIKNGNRFSIFHIQSLPQIFLFPKHSFFCLRIRIPISLFMPYAFFFMLQAPYEWAHQQFSSISIILMCGRVFSLFCIVLDYEYWRVVSTICPFFITKQTQNKEVVRREE